MTAKVIKVLLLVALAAGLVFAIVRGYEAWRAGVYAEGDRAGAARVQQQWDEDVKKSTAATLVAVAKARKEEQDAAAAAVQGEKDARERAERRAQVAARAASAASAAAGGLSRDIAALDAAARSADLPTAAACPGELARERSAAIRARAVLGSCAAEHRSLAQAADAAVGELTLQLDTALGYIRALPGGP